MRTKPRASGWSVAVLIVWATGCAAESPVERLSEARKLTAELLLQFTKAADAANRVMIADTDASAAAFAREADHVKEAVQRETVMTNLEKQMAEAEA